MVDIVLVTADSVRRDYVDEMSWIASHDVCTGVTAGNYTRPGLASLLSSSYRSAIESRVAAPTIADVLSDHGYTCLGYSPTPNTDATFGFASGFDEYDTFVERGRVGNRVRQYLSKYDSLRRLYYKINPPQAKSENRPTDRDVVAHAIQQYNQSSAPRFLWVHLMESHRPYGRGDTAVSRRLDQKAYFSPDDLTAQEERTIDEKYRDSLARVDDTIRTLYQGVEGDPAFVFTADHGECFGESGFYYHPGHERSVADELIEVPVVTKGVEVGGTEVSLLDVCPTLVANAELDRPNEWQGRNLLEDRTEYALTIAPWHGKATMAWQDFERKIVARNADVSLRDRDDDRSEVERADVDADLEEQLRDLGYMDAG